MQQASDVAALELLLAAPGTNCDTRLYCSNRLHAKIYIFDKRRVFLGSSNLSITGLDRNVEAVTEIDDAHIAAQLIAELEQRSLFTSRLEMSDLHSMRMSLGRLPTDMPDTAASEDPEVELQQTLQATIDQPAADYLVGPIGLELAPENTERELAIDLYLQNIASREANLIDGIPAESIRRFGELSLGERQDESKLSDLCSAAQRDLNTLESRIVPRLGIQHSGEDRVPLLSPFLDQSWIAKFKLDHCVGLGHQEFGQLGESIAELEVANFLAMTAYDEAEPGLADLALQSVMAVSEDHCAETLRVRGLSTFLHIVSDLPRNFNYKRLCTIAGLKCYYAGASQARSFVRAAFDDLLSSDALDRARYSPKHLLARTAQATNDVLEFRTGSASGPEHDKTFSSLVLVSRRPFPARTGRTKKEAEHLAAKAALDHLSKESRYKAAIDLLGRPMGRKQLGEYHLSRERRDQCAAVARELGIAAGHENLVDIALTHRSCCGPDRSARSYARLAFVGSRVRDVLMHKAAIRSLGWRSDEARAGGRAAAFRRLTAGPATLQAFESMRLADAVRCGPAQNDLSPGMKSDITQAILAAAFISQGMDAAERLFLRFIMPLLSAALRSTSGTTQLRKDPTQELQELLQGRGTGTPHYEYGTRSDSANPLAPIFEANCCVNGVTVGFGVGRSKKNARVAAARDALDRLGQKGCETPDGAAQSNNGS